MSKLFFDGTEHKVHFIDKDGTDLGSWEAYNNVDSHASLTHIPNGTYSTVDKSVPHLHPGTNKDTVNGSYGSYGIIRFNVPGHSGIGLHSGRANGRGAQHPTFGCIRTTDEAMKEIKRLMLHDPISSVEVSKNSNARAHHSTHKYHSRHPHSGPLHA